MARKKNKTNNLGRKYKYETHVKPRLAEITEWRRTMTEAQICIKLGIGRTAFYEYKKEHREFERALRTGETMLVGDLKGALIKKALGYEYKEKETIVTKIKGKTSVTTKTKEKHMPADLGSIHLLLKNLDPDWRNDDAETRRLKREELEIKKQKAAAEDW